MSQPTTSIGFSPSTPAAPAGYQNTVPQSDNGTPLQKLSEYVPNTGGVAAKTANYTAVAGDCGLLLSFNSSSAITLTLPAAAPFAQWNVGVQNIGTGTLTVSRNGLLIDTAAANLTLGQGSGAQISTDGTNYFTERGVAQLPSGAANLVVATPNGSSGQSSLRALVAADIPNLPESQITNLTTDLAAKAAIASLQQEAYTYAADTGAANAYAVALTPAPTIVAGSVVCFIAAHANTGASTLAVNGGSATAIKKNGNSTALASGDIQAAQLIKATYDGTVWQISSSGSSLTLEHDGAANGSQTLLNLKSTSTIAVSDDGSGGVSLNAVNVVPASIRGSNIITGTGASLTISLPAGSAAGDLALLFANSGWTPSVPSGWSGSIGASASQWQQICTTKVLSSGDISTGSVTVAFSGSFDCVLGILVFVGAPTIRENESCSNTFGSQPNTTSGAVLNSDLAIYWSTQRSGTVPTITPASGSAGTLQSGTTTNGGSILASQVMPGGALAVTSTFVGGVYWVTIQVIVEGVPSGVGTISSVALSMPADFSVSGSPSGGPSVSLAVTGGVTKLGVQQEAYTYAADTGTANAYAVALTPTPTIAAGSTVCFLAAHANTGASTLAVNGGSATAIRKNGTTVLASGDIAAGQIIDATYDGTFWQILVPGSGGGGSTLYFGSGDAVASTGQDQITLGSTPIAGSVKPFVDGLRKASTTYTLAGSVITLGSAMTSGDIALVDWVTLNSTPSGITLGTSTPSNPVLRGTGIQASSSGSYTVSWPAGTIAGDLAVICAGHGFSYSNPSGWTVNDNSAGGFWNGAVWSKILTSGDISTGSVTITPGGGFDGVIAIATFVGNTAGIRETVVQRNSGGSSSITLNTSGAPLTTDTCLYFGSNRAGSTDTVNRGTLEQQATDGSSASGCLYAEALASAGTVTSIFAYSSAGSGNYQAIVVVKGV